MEMHIQNQQGKQQKQHDKNHLKMHELSSCDSVKVRNTRGRVEKWVPSTVSKVGAISLSGENRVATKLCKC